MYADAIDGRFGPEKHSLIENRVKITKTVGAGTVNYTLAIRYGEIGAPNVIQTEMKFAASAGFNVVEYKRTRGGILDRAKTIEYKDCGGIFMPAKAVLQYVTIRDGTAVPRLDRELKLIECDLTSEIPDGKFSIEDVGLKYGCLLYDRIAGNVKVFDGSSFVPAESFKLDRSKLPKKKAVTIPTESRSRLWWMFVANLSLLAAIGVVYAMRQQQLYGKRATR